jgi:hypothetical protein
MKIGDGCIDIDNILKKINETVVTQMERKKLPPEPQNICSYGCSFPIIFNCRFDPLSHQIKNVVLYSSSR